MRYFLLALMSWSLTAQDVKLWPNAVTDAEVSLPSEDPRYPKKFTVVHQPSIYPFLPAKEKATGVALIIAPHINQSAADDTSAPAHVQQMEIMTDQATPSIIVGQNGH